MLPKGREEPYGEDVRGRVPVADRVSLRAWLLLRAASQDLTGGRADPVVCVRRVVVLRRPDLARRVGLGADSPELVAAERFLERRGYVRAVSAGTEPRAFLLTDVGKKWLVSDRWVPPWWRRLIER
jgi:hypothetical protein